MKKVAWFLPGQHEFCHTVESRLADVVRPGDDVMVYLSFRMIFLLLLLLHLPKLPPPPSKCVGPSLLVSVG